jgi:hypothetical protein
MLTYPYEIFVRVRLRSYSMCSTAAHYFLKVECGELGMCAPDEWESFDVTFQLRREFGAGTPLSLSVLERRSRRLPGFATCDEDDGMGLEDEWWDGAVMGWRMIGSSFVRSESSTKTNKDHASRKVGTSSVNIFAPGRIAVQ